MIRSAEEFVRLLSSDVKSEYRRAREEQAAPGVWEDVIARYPEDRVWVVLNRTSPIALLARLAEDEDASVRSAVAGTRRIDLETFRRLARDSDAGVRLAVARNANVPSSVLESLVSDEWDEVARVARMRLGLSDE